MLDIFSMLSDQSRTQFNELLSQLWNELCADEVFDGCLRIGVGVDVYIELEGVSWLRQRRPGGTRRHTTYSFSSVSCAISGIVIVPLTSSSSLVLPYWSACVEQKTL